MKKKWIVLFVALMVSVASVVGQPEAQVSDRFEGPWSSGGNDFPINNSYLPFVSLDDSQDQEILAEEILNFCRREASREVWGVGKQIDPVFDHEYLPVFFQRELVFDKLKLDSGMIRWVFTGNDGGWTVQVSRDSVHLYQRFYNSYGFYQVANNKAKGYRHNNKIWLVSATGIKGELKTLKISTDHKYNLVLELNGREIARQETVIDVFREQIQFTRGVGDICGKLMKPAVKTADIYINSRRTHQKILGFGGIMSIPAYHELGKEGKDKWWQIMKEYNLMIQREYPVGQMLNENYSNWDDLSVASPHYYGDNFPNGEISDFDFSKRIIENGGMVTFEFWKLSEMFNKPDGSLDLNKYTEAILSYCKTLKEQAGAYPAIVGIQNEMWQSGETWRRMTLALRKALDEHGMKEVKIHMFNPTSAQGGIEAAKAFREDPKVWEAIDFAASNMYDYQNVLQAPENFDSTLYKLKARIGDKPFINTELAINHSKYQAHTYRTAFSLAMLYHGNMTILNAVSLQYCWTLLNTPQETFDMTRSLLGIDEKNGFVPEEQGYNLRTFGAFSRRLPQGSIRVDATSDEDDILATAYHTENGLVAIVLNKGLNPVRLNCNLDFSEMEQVSWEEQNKTVKIPNELIIQPGEIFTLIGNSGSTGK